MDVPPRITRLPVLVVHAIFTWVVPLHARVGSRILNDGLGLKSLAVKRAHHCIDAVKVSSEVFPRQLIQVELLDGYSLVILMALKTEARRDEC